MYYSVKLSCALKDFQINGPATARPTGPVPTCLNGQQEVATWVFTKSRPVETTDARCVLVPCKFGDRAQKYKPPCSKAGQTPAKLVATGTTG